MNWRSIKFFFQYFLIGKNKRLYKYVTTTIGKHKDLIVNQYTDIVIEGYPRCGNTFAVAAFKYAQQKHGNNVKIARHRHEIVQVLLGIEYKIPILILIREPLEAISSFIVRENINPKFAIKYYIYYYKYILELKDNLIIADFKKVIRNYGEVIKEINKKYNKNFIIFEHTSQAMKEVKKIIENMEIEDSGSTRVRITHLAFPTKEREKLKKRIKNIILNNEEFLKLLNEAQGIYQKIT